MGVRLPAEYQEVEYIEATGTQAFFTDVPIQDNLTVDSVQTFSGGDCYLFGGHSGKGLQSCFNGYWSSRMQNAYAGYYHWALNSISQNNTTIYHVVSTQRNGYQSGYLNGELLLNGTRTTTADVSAGANAVAFGQRNASGAINQWYRGKVYSLKVSKDGVQLANYVPCYRKADGEIGMYDLVLQKFYVNEGTGVFLKGNDVIDSISPWLVAWRRAMMRKPPLDTSPRIAEYGKCLNRSNTGISSHEGDCYTEWYDVDPVSSAQRTMVAVGVPDYSTRTFQTQTANGVGNWDYFQSRPYLHANAAKIRFTLITARLDDCYIYCVQSGQIFFAGKNSQYYGYTNINDMPQG